MGNVFCQPSQSGYLKTMYCIKTINIFTPLNEVFVTHYLKHLG